MRQSLPSLSVALIRGARLIEARLAKLEQRIHDGDETVWPDYLVTIEAAAKLDQQLAPGAHGELLTTRAMAERLGIAPKTLLRRKSQRQVSPAMQAGRLIRWKGTEAVR
jgi:hypothetical protein